MIGFLLRKNFYDLWDSLFGVALLNLGFVVLAAGTILLPFLFPALPAVGFSLMGIGALACCTYLVMCALVLQKVSDYGRFGFADFFATFREAWPAGLLLGGILAVLALLAVIAIPFYLRMGGLFGVFAAAIVFWTLVIVALSLQFYLPIRARLNTDLRKVIKKCFILFFDNPGLAVFSAIHNGILLPLSGFVAFLVPGPAGAILFMDQALRLRLMKYDWLEQHPDANRRKIPWEEILIDEREKTGTRTLRNFFFPWKY